MAHAEGTITIERPVKDVFDFLLEGMNNKLWRPAVIDIERIPANRPGLGRLSSRG